MMQHERGGVVITETRQQGVTLAEEITRRFGKRKGVWPFRHTEVPKTPTSDLKFGDIGEILFSLDLQHFVATARDEDQAYLIRDDEVLLSGDFEQIILVETSDAHSRLFVKTQARNGSWSLIHFENSPQGVVLLQEQHSIQQQYSRGKLHLFTAGGEDALTFAVIDLEYGYIANSFNAPGIKSNEIRVNNFNSDLTQIAWELHDQTEKADQAQETEYQTYTLYLNERERAAKTIDHRFSDDFSTLLVLREDFGKDLEIRFEKDTVASLRVLFSGLRPSGFFYHGIIGNSDLSWAAVALENDSGKYVYYITPGGHGQIGPFDSDKAIEMKAGDERIEGTVYRNGVGINIIIQLSDDGKSPAVKEANAA